MHPPNYYIHLILEKLKIYVLIFVISFQSTHLLFHKTNKAIKYAFKEFLNRSSAVQRSELR